MQETCQISADEILISCLSKVERFITVKMRMIRQIEEYFVDSLF